MKYISFHVRKNDLVQVIAGKEKGKTGKVLKVFPKKDRVAGGKGELYQTPFPAFRQDPTGGDHPKGGPDPCLQCPPGLSQMQQGERMGRKVLEDGKKALVCKACGELIERK